MTSSFQPRKPAGSPQGGQFDNKPHDQIMPELDEPVLQGSIWSLPSWDMVEKDPRALLEYSREAVIRTLGRFNVSRYHTHFRGEVDLSELDVEELASEVCAKVYEREDKQSLHDVGQFVGGVARNVVRDALRGSLNSVDVKAGAIYSVERDNLEQVKGHNLTTSEEDELAEQIRSTWREKYGGKRSPIKGFHRRMAREMSDSEGAFNTMAAGSGAMEDLIREQQHFEKRAERIVNERAAGQRWQSAVRQLENKMGRPLTDSEEDIVALRVRRIFRESDTAPREFFHREPTSFTDSPWDAWSAAADNLTSNKMRGGARGARMIAWNAVAEAHDAPMVKVGSMSSREAAGARNAVLSSEGGVLGVARAWEDGVDTSLQDALFAPFGRCSTRRKQAIVDELVRLGPTADMMWESSVATANKRNEKKIHSFGL